MTHHRNFMKESINTSPEKPWLKSLLEGLDFQEGLVNDIKKDNQIKNFGHIRDELHSEEFAQSEIISQAKMIVEKFAPKCATLLDMKERIERLYRVLLDRGIQTTADEIKKATYSYLLSRLK